MWVVRGILIKGRECEEKGGGCKKSSVLTKITGGYMFLLKGRLDSILKRRGYARQCSFG